jgi:hypothetical protein
MNAEAWCRVVHHRPLVLAGCRLIPTAVGTMSGPAAVDYVALASPF